jgi:hypothetical protein
MKYLTRGLSLEISSIIAVLDNPESEDIYYRFNYTQNDFDCPVKCFVRFDSIVL